MTFPTIQPGSGNGSQLIRNTPTGVSAVHSNDPIEAAEKQVLADKNLQILKKVFGIKTPKPIERIPSEPSVAPIKEPSTTNASGFSASFSTSVEISRVTETQLSFTNTNGDSININILRAERFQFSSRVDISAQASSEEPKQKDPLILDLDGDGIETSGIKNGVSFDLDADGYMDQISVATGGDAMLALDRNNNGTIDDGRELFGDHDGYHNGFDSLSQWDENRDGIIDANDAVFSRLRLLTFAGNQQQTQSLSDAGIKAIHLAYTDVERSLNNGDRVTQMGSFEYNDQRQGEIADAMLSYQTPA